MTAPHLAAQGAPASAFTPSQPNTPGPGVQRLRAVSIATLLALIALCLAWELWLAPTGSGTLALKVVPLVLCLVGLLRHRMSTYRWLALLLWLYVLEGLVRATTESGLSQALAIGELMLCLLLFTTSTIYIRWRLKAGALTSAAAAAAEAQVANAADTNTANANTADTTAHSDGVNNPTASVNSAAVAATKPGSV